MKRGEGCMSENGICFNLESDFPVGLAQLVSMRVASAEPIGQMFEIVLLCAGAHECCCLNRTEYPIGSSLYTHFFLL